jgi:hypothetical protein
MRFTPTVTTPPQSLVQSRGGTVATGSTAATALRHHGLHRQSPLHRPLHRPSLPVRNSSPLNPPWPPLAPPPPPRTLMVSYLCLSPLSPLSLSLIHVQVLVDLLVYPKWNRNHLLDPPLDDPKSTTLVSEPGEQSD